MSIGSLWERFAAHTTPSNRLTLVENAPETAEERETLKELSRGTRKWLWAIAIADMASVAWMIGIGKWLDSTSRFTAVITLGGNHLLVLVLAVIGFLMLATAALLTQGFTSVSKLGMTLITVACMISIIALAGALSLILFLAAGGLLVGFVARLFLH
jgi:hypothetical protein